MDALSIAAHSHHASAHPRRPSLIFSALRFLVLCGALGFFTAANASAHTATPTGFFLEVEMANPAGGWGHLFYDIGQWYSGVDSCRVEIPAGTALRPYRFPIPAKPVKHLRFDPADGAADLRIGRLRLLTADGTELASFGPEKLVPMHAIDRFQLLDGVAVVKTGADDPMLLIARPLQQETTTALGRPLVTRAHLWILGFVVTLLSAWGIWITVRTLVPSPSPSRPLAPAAAPAATKPRQILWVLLGAFLVVLGARLHWLKLYSRPMPFWDEWETDAITLLIPLRGGFLDWEALFIPQGEHRILLTRLITLLGSIANGEWDPRVGMVAGALFFAGSVSLVCAAVVQASPRLGFLAVVALVSWACLPFDWRNVYWGDQSQMYALNFFAVATLLLATSESLGPRVWLGAFALSAVSLFTMGSGLVAPGLAAALCLLRWRTEPTQRRGLALLGGIFLGVALVGLCLYRQAPYQGSAYTQTLAQFLPPLVSRLSWPFSPDLAWAAVVWFPWLALFGFSLKNRRATPLTSLALGVGAWALINAAGLAHGRPTDLPPFDTKYYTALSLAVTAAVLSTVALLAACPPRARWFIVSAAAAVALASTVVLVQRGLAGFQGSRDQHTERLANDNLVRPFLATGDPTQLRATPFTALPYWNGAELADVLDSPLLQPWLPAALRTSLAQRPGSPLHGPQPPGPLTVIARSLMLAGPFIFFAGCGLLLWPTLKFRRPNRAAARLLSLDPEAILLAAPAA